VGGNNTAVSKNCETVKKFKCHKLKVQKLEHDALQNCKLFGRVLALLNKLGRASEGLGGISKKIFLDVLAFTPAR